MRKGWRCLGLLAVMRLSSLAEDVAVRAESCYIKTFIPLVKFPLMLMFFTPSILSL